MPIDSVKGLSENREPGANPGRYRHCMCGGSVFDESRSLGKPEKAAQSCGCISQENCLYKSLLSCLQVRDVVVFCCGKTAAAPLGVAAFVLPVTVTGCNPLALCGGPLGENPQNELNNTIRYGLKS